MLVRQADCPNGSPGGDCETQHHNSLYRDWRRRAQIVMCIVVGNVGNRACSTIQILVGKDVTIPQVTAKNDPPEASRISSVSTVLVPVDFWYQPGSGVSTFLMPVDFWCQHSSGASPALVPVYFRCQSISGASPFLVPVHFWCQSGSGVSRFLVGMATGCVLCLEFFSPVAAFQGLPSGDGHLSCAPASNSRFLRACSTF
jgi:hypothetical protein